MKIRPFTPHKHVLLFLLSFCAFMILGENSPRTIYQYLASVLSALFFELLFQRVRLKTSFSPLSSIITAHGTFLLCHTPLLWPYVLINFIAIASKHYFRPKDKHLFNPNNFGIIIALFLTGYNFFTVAAGNWGGSVFLSLALCCLGLHLAYRINRLPLILSFACSYVLFGLYRTFQYAISYKLTLGSLIGPASVLYVFYMLTDPRTTPNNSKTQIGLGVLIAFIDLIFKVQENKYSLFYALFLALPLLAIFQLRKPKQV